MRPRQTIAHYRIASKPGEAAWWTKSRRPVEVPATPAWSVTTPRGVVAQPYRLLETERYAALSVSIPIFVPRRQLATLSRRRVCWGTMVTRARLPLLLDFSRRRLGDQRVRDRCAACATPDAWPRCGCSPSPRSRLLRPGRGGAARALGPGVRSSQARHSGRACGIRRHRF